MTVSQFKSPANPSRYIAIEGPIGVGKTALADITRVAVNKWLRGPHTQRRDGQQASSLSRKHYMTVVGGFFNFAIEQDYIKSNPLAKKSRRRRKRSLGTLRCATQ